MYQITADDNYIHPNICLVGGNLSLDLDNDAEFIAKAKGFTGYPAKFYKFFDGEKKLVYDETSIGVNSGAFYTLWLEVSGDDKSLLEERILGSYTSISEVRTAVAQAMTRLESWSDNLLLCVTPNQFDHPIDLNIWANRPAELIRKQFLADIWLNYAKANSLDGEALLR